MWEYRSFFWDVLLKHYANNRIIYWNNDDNDSSPYGAVCDIFGRGVNYDEFIELFLWSQNKKIKIDDGVCIYFRQFNIRCESEATILEVGWRRGDTHYKPHIHKSYTEILITLMNIYIYIQTDAKT